MTEFLLAGDPAMWLIENDWLVPIGFATLIAGMVALFFGGMGRLWCLGLGLALTAWAAILLGGVHSDAHMQALKDRVAAIEAQLEESE